MRFSPLTVDFKASILQLAARRDTYNDDRNVNAVSSITTLPTEADLADLQTIGIVGGTRFRVLPAVTVTGTPVKSQRFGICLPFDPFMEIER